MKKLLLERTIALLISCTLVYSAQAYKLTEVENWSKSLSNNITENITAPLLTALNQYEIEQQLKTLDSRLATSTLTQEDLDNLIVALQDFKEEKRSVRGYRQPRLSNDAQAIFDNIVTSIESLKNFYPVKRKPSKMSEQQIVRASDAVITQIPDRLIAILQSYQPQQAAGAAKN